MHEALDKARLSVAKGRYHGEGTLLPPEYLGM